MWRAADDLRQLVQMVNGRAKVMPLLETDSAAENLPEAVKVPGIDQMHIGLNDLHLCYPRRFLFQLLATARWTGFARSSAKQIFPTASAAWAVPARGCFRRSISSVSTADLARSM